MQQGAPRVREEFAGVVEAVVGAVGAIALGMYITFTAAAAVPLLPVVVAERDNQETARRGVGAAVDTLVIITAVAGAACIMAALVRSGRAPLRAILRVWLGAAVVLVLLGLGGVVTARLLTRRQIPHDFISYGVFVVNAAVVGCGALLAPAAALGGVEAGGVPIRSARDEHHVDHNRTGCGGGNAADPGSPSDPSTGGHRSVVRETPVGTTDQAGIAAGVSTGCPRSDGSATHRRHPSQASVDSCERVATGPAGSGGNSGRCGAGRGGQSGATTHGGRDEGEAGEGGWAGTDDATQPSGRSRGACVENAIRRHLGGRHPAGMGVAGGHHSAASGSSSSSSSSNYTRLRQAYIVVVSALLAWAAAHLPSWTTWGVLAAAALHDTWAVLSEGGSVRGMLAAAAAAGDPTNRRARAATQHEDANGAQRPPAVPRLPGGHMQRNHDDAHEDGNADADADVGAGGGYKVVFDDDATDSDASIDYFAEMAMAAADDGDGDGDGGIADANDDAHGDSGSPRRGAEDDDDDGDGDDTARANRAGRGEGEAAHARRGSSRHGGDPAPDESTLAPLLYPAGGFYVGVSDFVFYTLLAARSALDLGGCPILAVPVVLAMLVALAATLAAVAVVDRPLPALPLPVLAGALTHALQSTTLVHIYTLQSFGAVAAP